MTSPNEIMEGVTGRIGDLLREFYGPASTDSVFGHVTDSDGALVMTAGAWERVGGFGFGGGGGTNRDGDDGGGGGGGGGGVSQARAVAVIRVTEDGVQVTPVVDLTKVAVTALLGAAALWKALR